MRKPIISAKKRTVRTRAKAKAKSIKNAIKKTSRKKPVKKPVKKKRRSRFGSEHGDKIGKCIDSAIKGISNNTIRFMVESRASRHVLDFSPIMESAINQAVAVDTVQSYESVIRLNHMVICILEHYKETMKNEVLSNALILFICTESDSIINYRPGTAITEIIGDYIRDDIGEDNTGECKKRPLLGGSCKV